ncbi:MAG: diacylglycerol kinase family protein [Dehalococcoidia bacterium]|jgi:diacylglycerol kinase family enzyme
MYYAKVIVNPMSRGGATGKTWPIINKLLGTTGLPFDYEFISAPGQGIELSRQAVEKGYNLVIAVGGDGTVNEVANGLMDEHGKGRATLGVIAAGTQNDIARMLGIPRDYLRACQLFRQFEKVSIDIGAVEYTLRNEVRSRYYINTAGIGFVSDVIEGSIPHTRLKVIGGSVPYAIGVIPKVLDYHNKDLLICIDGEKRQERDFSVVVNNGRYLGGGRTFPNATPYDGLLDVAVIGNLSKLEALLNFPLFFTGTYSDPQKIKFQKARSIIVDSPQRLPIQIDGEIVGRTPAVFRIIPSALEVAALILQTQVKSQRETTHGTA